mmetsp:Transcript_2931/g.7033  ORF Transcript_2931/g.7033 Transcript_2931/m.7033 type:complete len:95 (-) Transcript_2931:12-296(-)
MQNNNNNNNKLRIAATPEPPQSKYLQEQWGETKPLAKGAELDRERNPGHKETAKDHDSDNDNNNDNNNDNDNKSDSEIGTVWNGVRVHGITSLS